MGEISAWILVVAAALMALALLVGLVLTILRMTKDLRGSDAD